MSQALVQIVGGRPPFLSREVVAFSERWDGVLTHTTVRGVVSVSTHDQWFLGELAKWKRKIAQLRGTRRRDAIKSYGIWKGEELKWYAEWGILPPGGVGRAFEKRRKNPRRQLAPVAPGVLALGHGKQVAQARRGVTLCHPGQPHMARGMCAKCYWAWYIGKRRYDRRPTSRH